MTRVSCRLLPTAMAVTGWVRVALSSVLLKYAYKIMCQFSSRRAFECDPLIYLRLLVFVCRVALGVAIVVSSL